MDGMNFVCYCCNKFTDVKRTAIVSDDPEDFAAIEDISKCCNTDIFRYPDEEIEDFKEVIKDLEHGFDLDERELALYNAIMNEEED